MGFTNKCHLQACKRRGIYDVTIRGCAGINSRRARGSRLGPAAGRHSRDVGSSAQGPGMGSHAINTCGVIE